MSWVSSLSSSQFFVDEYRSLYLNVHPEHFMVPALVLWSSSDGNLTLGFEFCCSFVVWFTELLTFICTAAFSGESFPASQLALGTLWVSNKSMCTVWNTSFLVRLKVISICFIWDFLNACCFSFHQNKSSFVRHITLNITHTHTHTHTKKSCSTWKKQRHH